MKNIQAIAREFVKLIKDGDVISIGCSKYDKELIDELVKIFSLKKIKCVFVATTSSQARQLYDLSQETISLNDKEIDIAIEFVEEVDQYNNFIKKQTKSFIRDKMISQSALTVIVVVDKENVVDNIDKDLYVEISTFAWERTILNLQSYGVARIVMDLEENLIKTEIGHYIARITLDKNISLEDFEYSVRNIPGVLETGVFLGMVDTMFVLSKKPEDIKVITRTKI